MQPGLNNMVIGAGIAALGLIATVGSYNLGFGGRFVVAYGAILVGLVQFSVGAVQYTVHASRSLEQRAKHSKQAAYNGLVRSLIAMSIVDGEINDWEIECIEMIYQKLYGDQFERKRIRKLAGDFKRDSFDLINDLSNYWSQISSGEREFIIKCSWLVAFADGRINEMEQNMIARLATVLRIESTRFRELLRTVTIPPFPSL
jgi:uncharacterized tellurite resistance protein B-like protein